MTSVLGLEIDSTYRINFSKKMIYYKCGKTSHIKKVYCVKIKDANTTSENLTNKLILMKMTGLIMIYNTRVIRYAIFQRMLIMYGF